MNNTKSQLINTTHTIELSTTEWKDINPIIFICVGVFMIVSNAILVLDYIVLRQRTTYGFLTINYCVGNIFLACSILLSALNFWSDFHPLPVVCVIVRLCLMSGLCFNLCLTFLICVDQFICLRSIPQKELTYIGKRKSKIVISMFILSFSYSCIFIPLAKNTSLKKCDLADVFENNTILVIVTMSVPLFILLLAILIIYYKMYTKLNQIKSSLNASTKDEQRTPSSDAVERIKHSSNSGTMLQISTPSHSEKPYTVTDAFNKMLPSRYQVGLNSLSQNDCGIQDTAETCFTDSTFKVDGIEDNLSLSSGKMKRNSSVDLNVILIDIEDDNHYTVKHKSVEPRNTNKTKSATKTPPNRFRNASLARISETNSKVQRDTGEICAATSYDSSTRTSYTVPLEQYLHRDTSTSENEVQITQPKLSRTDYSSKEDGGQQLGHIHEWRQRSIKTIRIYIFQVFTLVCSVIIGHLFRYLELSILAFIFNVISIFALLVSPFLYAFRVLQVKKLLKRRNTVGSIK